MYQEQGYWIVWYDTYPYVSLCNHSFLVQEGKAGQPKMMTVGLHCRLARPGRVAAIQQFLDYAKSYGTNVWICTREEIANHWYENHLPRGVGSPITPDGATATTPSDSTSRFSFLGNIAAPRDTTGTIPSTTPDAESDPVPESEGDII